MEKVTYAKGDEVYISGKYQGSCAAVFGKIDRKHEQEGMWWVTYADRNHPVPEQFIEFKMFKPQTRPRFNRGDRILSMCPGNTTKDKLGTVLHLADKDHERELYRVRLDGGKEVTMSLGWLQPAPDEGPTYVKGDKVEVTVPWEKQDCAVVEAFDRKNESGHEVYVVRYKDGTRHMLDIAWLQDYKEPELPEPKYKVGDVLVDHKEFVYPKVEVVDISDFPDEDGRYVYQVRQGTEERWVNEVWLRPVVGAEHPAQEEIDAIDKLREPIIEEITRLQEQLRVLNQIKEKLTDG